MGNESWFSSLTQGLNMTSLSFDIISWEQNNSMNSFLSKTYFHLCSDAVLYGT